MRSPYTGSALGSPARALRPRPGDHAMTTPPAALEDALSWLAAQRGPMVTLLRALVEASSPTSDPAGVAAALSALEPALADAGLATERLASRRFGPHLAFRGPAA